MGFLLTFCLVYDDHRPVLTCTVRTWCLKYRFHFENIPRVWYNAAIWPANICCSQFFPNGVLLCSLRTSMPYSISLFICQTYIYYKWMRHTCTTTWHRNDHLWLASLRILLRSVKRTIFENKKVQIHVTMSLKQGYVVPWCSFLENIPCSVIYLDQFRLRILLLFVTEDNLLPQNLCAYPYHFRFCHVLAVVGHSLIAMYVTCRKSLLFEIIAC